MDKNHKEVLDREENTPQKYLKKMNLGKMILPIIEKPSLSKLTKLISNIHRQKYLLLMLALFVYCHDGWSQTVDAKEVELNFNKITKEVEAISDQLDKKKLSNDSLNNQLQILYA